MTFLSIFRFWAYWRALYYLYSCDSSRSNVELIIWNMQKTRTDGSGEKGVEEIFWKMRSETSFLRARKWRNSSSSPLETKDLDLHVQFQRWDRWNVQVSKTQSSPRSSRTGISAWCRRKDNLATPSIMDWNKRRNKQEMQQFFRCGCKPCKNLEYGLDQNVVCNLLGIKSTTPKFVLRMGLQILQMR